MSAVLSQEHSYAAGPQHDPANQTNSPNASKQLCRQLPEHRSLKGNKQTTGWGWLSSLCKMRCGKGGLDRQVPMITELRHNVWAAVCVSG